MIAIGLLFVRMLCDYFKSRPQLEAEIVILRHQLNLLQRRAPRRPYLRWVDRALFICRGVQNLLALEIATARRPARDTGRHSPAHS
jgi:hypothetical protein